MSLEELGLTADEDAVYQALVRLPAARRAEVADAAALPDHRVEDALSLLVDRGLAALTTDGERYAASPPAVALGAELAAQRERLLRAELTVTQLVEAYRTVDVDRAERDLVEIVHGTAAIRRRHLQLQLSARSTIDILSAGDPRAVAPDDSQEVTAIGRSVRVRAVVDRTFLTEPGAQDQVAQSVEDGVEVRVVDRVPCKLILVDGETAMLPLRCHGEDVDPTVVLRDGLAQVAAVLFEQVWTQGRPYLDPHPAIDVLDTHILRLLLAGLTDSAVAGQLGMSVRTVQRRLQALMARAQVTTRLQLGWHAKHHSWV
ncbi:helix-turn-helix domain-containing protein [Streptomyces zaomyceticus]|uniref:helix-turn-helix domain-containing protein n=1 Tax=Streptomyces zaomyceticus TaxID=68286 RepID=UPI0016797309|nr:helix-turn-helix domain-containing protein [Streptomyces zaomyceticus]GHG11892.1 hypothetical protein GCM10018791_26690 [Streptomyces zaomyceticus]